MSSVSSHHRTAAPRHAGDLRLSSGQVGMLGFILAEASFFATLLMVYVVFLGQDRSGPTPAGVLSLPVVLASTACLLSSSLTVHLAHGALARGCTSRFLLYWAVTICLGTAFVVLTAVEWQRLIFHDGLTIRRNLFGTTYFTLVGFHASHVIAGVVAMLILLALARRLGEKTAEGARLISWYWHFVDCVWIVVFAVVYLFGR